MTDTKTDRDEETARDIQSAAKLLPRKCARLAGQDGDSMESMEQRATPIDISDNGDTSHSRSVLQMRNSTPPRSPATASMQNNQDTLFHNEHRDDPEREDDPTPVQSLTPELEDQQDIADAEEAPEVVDESLSKEIVNDTPAFLDEAGVWKGFPWGRLVDLAYVEPTPLVFLTMMGEVFGFKNAEGSVGVPALRANHDAVLKAVGIMRLRVHRGFNEAALASEEWNTMDYFFGMLNPAMTLPPAPGHLLSHLCDLCDSESKLYRSIDLKITKAAFADKLEECFWLIDAVFQPNRPHWQLAIPHASSVVLIIRMEWGPDPLVIIPQLVRRCIPFFWVVHTGTNPIIQPAIRPPRDVIRDVEDRPTVQELLSAEVDKFDFLSGPRGYAAFFTGGLYARFANEYADVSKIVSGPTPDAIWPGKLRTLVSINGPEISVYDPRLTAAEAETVAGGVQMLSECTLKASTCVKTFWPNDGVWRSVTVKLPMWTMSDEEWLLTRREGLRKCVEPNAYKTKSGWKTAVRVRSPAPTLAANYETICTTYTKLITDPVEVVPVDEYLV